MSVSQTPALCTVLSRGGAREPTHLSRQQDEGGIEQDQVEVDHDLQVSLYAAAGGGGSHLSPQSRGVAGHALCGRLEQPRPRG